MNGNRKIQCVSRMREQFNAFANSSSRMNRAFRSMIHTVRESRAECYLFGGCARDIYQFGARATPKDIDLVFVGDGLNRFLNAIQPRNCRENRFGGLNFEWQGFDIDAWNLKDTWAFQEGYFRDNVKAAILPQTTFLSLDAIAIELWPARMNAGRRVYEEKFFETITSNLLDINLDSNPFPELAVVRTICLAHKYGLGFTHRLASSLFSLMAEMSIKNLYALQQNHYSRTTVSVDDIAALFMRLLDHQNQNSSQPFYYFHSVSQQELPIGLGY